MKHVSPLDKIEQCQCCGVTDKRARDPSPNKPSQPRSDRYAWDNKDLQLVQPRTHHVMDHQWDIH